MDIALVIAKLFVIGLLNILQLALFARALLSWIDPMQEWRISSFLLVITEPVILPVRRLFERKRWLEGIPIDVPFMITLLLILLLSTFVQLL